MVFNMEKIYIELEKFNIGKSEKWEYLGKSKKGRCWLVSDTKTMNNWGDTVIVRESKEAIYIAEIDTIRVQKVRTEDEDNIKHGNMMAEGFSRNW